VAWSPEGSELWRTELDAESLKDYYEQNGYIYLGTFSGHRVLHADSGAVVRSRDVEWEFLASRPDRLYTTRGSSPGTPVTYEIADTRVDELWRVDTDCSVGRPAAGSERVYYTLDPESTADCDGLHRLKSVDTAGKSQWTVAFDADLWYPAVADDRVFVPMAAADGEPGRLALLGTEGERQWTHEASGGLKRATVADGTVYAVPTRSSTAPLVACDASSGDRLWERAVAPNAPLAVAEDTLYVGTDDGLVALV
jgi:outer membrane protein assembly factor BamB